MDVDWDEELLRQAHEDATAAQRNVVGTSDISSAHAAAARKAQAVTGVPADYSMRDPASVTGMADALRSRAILSRNGPIRAAAKSPSWVASTVNDWVPLERFSRMVEPLVNDFTTPLTRAWSAADQSKRDLDRAKGFVPRAQAGVRNLEAAAGVIFSPFVALTNPIARPLSENLKVPPAVRESLGDTFMGGPGIGTVSRGIGDALAGRDPFKSFAERYTDESSDANAAFYNQALGLAFGAKLPGKAGAGHIPGEAGPARPGGRPAPAPEGGGPAFTAEGFVADAEGNPAVFQSTREMAQYMRKNFAGDLEGVEPVAAGGRNQFHLRRTQPVKPPEYDPADNTVYQERAKADSTRVATMEQAAQETATLKSDPGALEELAQHTAPTARAWVPAQAIADIYAGGEEAPTFGLSEAELTDAMVRGGELEVPLSKYLAEVAGKPYADKLREVTRFSEEGLSVADADELAPAMEEIEGKPSVNARRMAKMLGPQLYGDPEATGPVTVKEIFQNSFDAIKALGGEGNISIKLDRDSRTIFMSDTGTGMDPELLAGKFLQIAGSDKPDKNASGGFGIAKMLFLYGNDKLSVRTLKGGKYSVMETSGPELMEGLEEGGAKPKINVKKSSEMTAEELEQFPQGHGTVIEITLPEKYTDPVSGEEKDIPFPTDYNIPGVTKSPLFTPVEVTIDTGYGGTPVKVGKNFPADEFTTFANVKFPWGTARIYVAKEPKRYGYSDNVFVLSNGLFQFSQKINKDPTNIYSDTIPYDVYIDIVPSVKPDEPDYPFGFNRQAFTENAKKDMQKVTHYIGAVYGMKALSKEAESFTSVQYVTQYGLSEPQRLAPDVPPPPTGFDITEGETVEVRDGELFVNGKQVPTMDPDQLKAAIPDAKTLKVDQKRIRSNSVMFHENVEVVVSDGDFGETMSFSSFMSKEFGKQWEEYLYDVGDMFRRIRDHVARIMGYDGLAKNAVGLSIDKSYHGVSIRVPFEGMFVNPIATRGETPLEETYALIGTMIHELAHYKVRSHNAQFPAEMQRIMFKLSSDDVVNWMGMQLDFVELLMPYDKLRERAREVFHEHSSNVGESFTDASKDSVGDGEEGSDAGGDRELDRSREGTEGESGVPEEPSDAARLSGQTRDQFLAGRVISDPPGDLSVEEAARARSALTATRRAIRETFAQAFIKQLFVDPKSAGMTKTQFSQYSEKLERAVNAATEKVLAKAYAAIKRERKPQFAEAIKRAVYDVEQLAEGDPALLARHALVYNETPLGVPLERPATKLSRKEIEDAYGKEITDALPKGLFGKNTLPADILGAEFGFTSGDEMVAALLDLQEDMVARGEANPKAHLKALVNETAADRVQKELGFDLSKESLEEAARDATVVPQVESLLVEELQQLAKQEGLPFDLEAVKGEATRQFQALTVKQGIDLRQFERSMYQNGKRGETFLLKGDVPAAFVLRQRQLLNWYMLEMAHELKRVLAASSKKYLRHARKKTVKGLNQEYLNQLHRLLPHYGFPSVRDSGELLEALGGVSLAQFLQGVVSTNPNFILPPAAAPQPFLKMVVEDFWATRAFLNDFIRYGREAHDLVTVEGMRTHEEMVARALAENPYGPGNPPPPRLGGRKNLPEEALSKLKGFDAAHRKITRMLEELGSYSFDSVWTELVWRTLNAGANKEAKLRDQLHNQLELRFNLIPKKVTRSYSKVIADHPFTAPNNRPFEIIRGDVMGMVLNIGTESSLEALANGLGSTPPDVLEFIDKHITLEEARLAQAFWDFFAELAPDVSENLRALRGVGLEKLSARVWRSPFGNFPGGYFPLLRDKDMSPLTPEEADADAMLTNSARILRDVSPDESFAKHRTGAFYVVNTSLSRAYAAFDNHIRFVSYARTLASIRRFVQDDRIRALVSQTLGVEYYEQIAPYLNSVVDDWTVSEPGMAGVEPWAGWTRRNLSIYALTGSATTTLAQIAGLPVIAAELAGGKPGAGTKWIGIGIKGFLKALATGQLDAAILNKSIMMRHRFGQSNPVAAEALDRMRGFHTYDEFRKIWNELITQGYNLIGFMEFMTASGPGWLGAYNKAIGEHGYDEAKAIEFADRVVEKSQGSGRRVDLSAVQRGNNFQRLLYIFNTAFNAQYQLTAEAVGRTRQGGGNPKTALPIIFGMMLLAPLMGNLLTDNGPEDLEPATIAEWIAKVTFFNQLRPVFFVGAPASVIDRNVKVRKGKLEAPRRLQDWDFATDPIARQAEGLTRLIALPFIRDKKGRIVDKRPISTVMRGVGTVVPIPYGAQITREAELTATATGRLGYPESPPKNNMELIHGMLFGPKPPKGKKSKRSARTHPE